MTITSLCYVPRPTNGNQIWMERIADWHNGAFQLFSRSAGRFGGLRTIETTDRLPIYSKDTNLPLSEGEIGVWDWYIDDNNKIIVQKFRADIVPIQVLSLSSGKTLPISIAADRLRNESVSFFVRTRRLAVLVDQQSGFLLDRNAFLIYAPKLRLREDIYSAVRFTIAVPPLVKNFVAADDSNVFLAFLNTTDISEGPTVLLRETSDAVRHFFLTRITKSTEGFSVTRQERHRFKEILAGINLQSFADDLAASLGWDRIAAVAAIEDFKTKIGSLDLSSDIEDILLHAFDKNAVFRKKCIDEGEKHWREDNEEVVKNARQLRETALSDLDERISELLAKRDGLDVDIENKKKELKTADDAVIAKKEELNKVVSTVEEARKAVGEQLEEIRSGIPKAFAEFSILRHALGSVEPVRRAGSPIGYEPGQNCDGSCEEFADFANARKALSVNLEKAGASKADLLSAWLCACAGSTGINLLFAGPRAESIATAFSVSIFGATPGVLDCAVADVASGEEAVSVDSSPVCIVRSPFDPKWVGRIPGLLERFSNNRRFVLCTPFAEDLAVEPESLFHGIVPVLTEPFAFGSATNAFKPGKIADGVVLRETTANLAFPDGVSARPWLLDTFKRVFRKAKSMQPITDGMLQNFLVWLPLAAISGNSTIVADAIKAEKMTFTSDSERVRSELLSFLS